VWTEDCGKTGIRFQIPKNKSQISKDKFQKASCKKQISKNKFQITNFKIRKLKIQVKLNPKVLSNNSIINNVWSLLKYKFGRATLFNLLLMNKLKNWEHKFNQ
jgi:hypothetical protein